jgi:hypothetical protein
MRREERSEERKDETFGVFKQLGYSAATRFLGPKAAVPEKMVPLFQQFGGLFGTISQEQFEQLKANQSIQFTPAQFQQLLVVLSTMANLEEQAKTEKEKTTNGQASS